MNPGCQVPGCSRPLMACGLCTMHYKRKRKRGTTDDGPTSHAPLSVRFSRYAVIRSRDECWSWTGSVNRKGYGVISRSDPGTRQAHRLSYEMHRGPIPPGLVIDHLCRNPPCVNPWHMEPVTSQENQRRGYAALPCKPAGSSAHCRNGHPRNEENTYFRASGKVRCRTCQREGLRRRRTIRRVKETNTAGGPLA